MVPSEWNGISFNLELLYGCNYRCSYCYWELGDLWDTMAKKYAIQPAARWVECWDKIYALYGSARINVVGGEPLLFPGIEDFLAGTTRRHHVVLTSNLSMPLEKLRVFRERISPERLFVVGSFHPQYARPEAFLEKMLCLRDQGYPVVATIVGWPPLLAKIPEWKNLFSQNGISTGLHVFVGGHDGKQYPASYADEERAFLTEGLTAKDREYWLNEKPTLGKLCGAGYVFADISANGEVYRCGSVKGLPLPPEGNVFDASFRLWDRPKSCPASVCKCGQYINLWEDYTQRHPEGLTKRS